MSRLTLAFAMWISVLAPTAFAQESIQFVSNQPCDNVVTMARKVTTEYNEKPLFSGDITQLNAQDDNWYRSSTMLFVNQETSTWSLISLYPDGTSCMVAAGINFAPYISK